jgi:hypothetical protein
MTTQVYAGVREILAGPDWEPVAVTDHGAFFTIAGMFKGTAHSGSRKDWRSLAADLDRIARELEARIAEELAEKVEPEPEPVSYNNGKIDEPEDEPEPAPAEPEPVIPDTSELDALRARLAELEAENARLKTPAEPHNFPANMSDRLTDWAEPGDLTTDQLTEDVIQKLTKEKRKKFTELLNVELAELQQERGGPREALSREAEIEKLLGLFARVGEM